MSKKAAGIILLVSILLLFTGCQGAGADPMSKPYIAVNGSGNVKAAPDTVEISITVATEDKDSSAQSKNAEKVEKIITYLKEAGVQENEIKTTGANFYPNKKWENGREIDLGFRAENFLQVKTKNLDLISTILDGSVKNGAERVSGLTYTLSEEGKKNLLGDVIQEAVTDAKNQAESAVSSLGKSLDGVKSVVVIKEYSSPVYMARENFGMGDAKEMAATPVLPGELDYSVSVSVEFFIK
jgi:uncharacterized protein YggE